MVVFTKFAVNPDGTSIIPLYLDYKFIAISGAIASSICIYNCAYTSKEFF
jgi:lipoprotein-releasing system permease protein